MVFGMAYLLVPSYVGRTLSTKRLPGIHLVVAYTGTGLLLGHALFGFNRFVEISGTVLWSIGIAIFVGTLLWTVVPTSMTSQQTIRQSAFQLRRTEHMAMMAIPIAVGYLIAGTVILLSKVLGVPIPLDPSFPMVVHLYATGFVSLLIFALGVRLMSGFFGVTPPKSLVYLILLCGGVAPGVLSANFYQLSWFLLGAALEFIPMMAYGLLVAIVVCRTDQYRVGLYGIALGALAGVVSVGVAFGAVIGFTEFLTISTHIVGVLDGFLFLTIIGYAYQFFPITNGQFWGATERFARTSILLLGIGTLFQVLHTIIEAPWLQTSGAGFALLGTSGYAYLMIQRFR